MKIARYLPGVVFKAVFQLLSVIPLLISEGIKKGISWRLTVIPYQRYNLKAIHILTELNSGYRFPW